MSRPDPFSLDRPLIAPSILSADFARLGDEVDEVLAAGADLLHLDVMDGHFVTNISFGPPIVEATRRHTDAYLDAHLMVSRPEDYAKPIAEAGADLVTFHAELPDNVRRTLGGITDAVAESGAAVGVALNPLTPAETIFPLLDDERLKLVLVMSVVPGYSGQSFMPEVLSKCEAIKNRLRFDQRLEIDGGIGPETIASARSAGVDWFVAASAIFGEEDRATAIADLRGRL